MSNKEIASRITELRKQKGLSQKELGKILGVSNKAVSKWENNESMPKTSTMIKLAELFEIDANELIGLNAVTNAGNEESDKLNEINKLKSENAILSTKLANAEKKKKRITIAVAFICIVGIIASAVIAFCFSGNNKINAGIKDAGKDNTKIVFCEHTFIPPNKEQELFQKNGELDIDETYFGEDKYAVYYDSNGNSQKVLITSNPYEVYVSIRVGSKTYYYFDEEYGKNKPISFANIEYLEFSPDYHKDYIYEYDYMEFYKYSDEDFVRKFCKFYDNKGKPVDQKIIEQYLTKDAYTVIAHLDYNVYDKYPSIYVEIGKVFKDNKKQAYFLDYTDGNAYELGKELTHYVY